MMTNRILLVDDDDSVCEVFQEGLEKRGFEVVPAANVNEATDSRWSARCAGRIPL
jgi:DNA-binding NtrC family response regulator